VSLPVSHSVIISENNVRYGRKHGDVGGIVGLRPATVERLVTGRAGGLFLN